jgi:hypothetical protein
MFILVAAAYSTWWLQIGWKGLDTKRFDAFLGLKYWNFNQSSTQS